MVKSVTLLSALLAFSSLAQNAVADPTRGWRPASDPFGNSETRRVVRYVSPGLMAADLVSLSFDISGHFPLSFYNLMGDQVGEATDFRRLIEEYPEDAEAMIEECNEYIAVAQAQLGPFVDEQDFMFCLLERAYSDATLEFSFLTDVTHLLYSDDPVLRVRGVGVSESATENYAPLIQLAAGEQCSGTEEASICAACFRDFAALAAGDPGAICGDLDQEHGVMAANVRIPYFALVSMMAVNQADFGPWVLTLQLERQSGSLFRITYASDDLLSALFGPRG